MSDPYREATRHERRRLPRFVKFLLVGGGLVAVTLAAAAVIAAIKFRNAFEESMEAHRRGEPAEVRGDIRIRGNGRDIRIDLSELAERAAKVEVEAIGNLLEDAHIEAIGDWLEEVDLEPVGDLLEETARGSVELEEARLDLERALREVQGSIQEVRGNIQVRSRGQEVHIDLSDLAKHAEEAEARLRQAIRDGIRIEAEGDDGGGWLVVSDGGGEPIVELRGSGEGGSIRIRGEARDGRLRIGAGDASFRVGAAAADLPDWVPAHPDAEVRRNVVSGRTRDADYGVAVLRTEAGPGDVFDWYLAELSSGGWESSVGGGSSDREGGEFGRRGGRRIVAKRTSATGREESLMVVVAGSRRDADRTNIVTLYKRDR